MPTPNTTTVTLTLHFTKVEADPDCGIPNDYYHLTDIYQDVRPLELSAKLEELLQNEINPLK